MNQPKALRLADTLEHLYGSALETEAAAELRSLHAMNAELVKALEGMEREFGFDRVHHGGLVHDEYAAITAAMEAISKAKEQL